MHFLLFQLIFRYSGGKCAKMPQTKYVMHPPGLYKHESVFISKLFCLFVGDISLTVQIRLVADQKNHLKYFTSLIYNRKQNNVFLSASLFVLGFRSKLKFLRKYSKYGLIILPSKKRKLIKLKCLINSKPFYKPPNNVHVPFYVLQWALDT